MTPVDVLVVGAGPAGAAAALTAARLGRSVVVCDRAEFPRDKTCGDGLTTQALRLLECLGVRRDELVDAGYMPVTEAVLVGPGGREIRLPLPTDGDCAGVVPREGFDALLVRHALAAGVDVRQGCAVDDVVIGADGVKVGLADGSTIEARHLLAADGHWSPVRRALHPDAPPNLGTWHGVRQYYDGIDDPRLWTFFYEDLLPGYAWIFPLPGGGANVGFVVRRAGRKGRELRDLWPDVLARLPLGPHAVPRGPMRAWPIPTEYDAANLTDGPVLYIGDAAQVVDAMTGEGIAQAIETGVLAAEAIAAGGTVDAVADRYTRAVDRALGRDLRFAMRLQRLLARPLGARLSFGAVDLMPWTRRNFGRWLFEGYPRALLLTPDRWRRDMFTSPGAYSV
ncbi:MAG: geranylgeranyl reductase family protein [Actinomycetota bacterium]|nr:geranylgeranyl reductase family protein [Actinomycetota bacterium]